MALDEETACVRPRRGPLPLWAGYNITKHLKVTWLTGAHHASPPFSTI
ncbi:hypothetical protein [Acinetobacter sp. ANC 3832]|nr:hypothetical protein [Acinetobacter sp. ANC 3832]